MNWLLIILIVLLALYITTGFRNGMLRMIYRLVSWVVILALVTFATPYVCDFIKSHSQLQTEIESSSKEKISELVVSATEDAVEKTSEEKVEAVNDLLQENMGIRLPKSIVEVLIGQENIADNFLESTGVYDKISSKIASLALMGIAFVICLLIWIVISHFIVKGIDKVDDVPALGTTNRVMGMVLGAAKGFVVIWTGFAILAFNATSDVGIKITSYIYESEILTWLYENNLVMTILMKYWK